MDIMTLLERIREHPDFNKAGMILCHNGVVRETSKNGRKVTGLRVDVDHKRLHQVITENRKRNGIVDIQVEIVEGKTLKVGDDVMLLVVAGNIRENVIPVLSDTLDAIKSTVTKKTEFYAADTSAG